MVRKEMARHGQDDGKQTWNYGELTVDDIIDAALRLARRLGVEKITMRLLADELGLSSMVTYYYIPSKKALLGLVADKVLERIEVPVAAGEWETRLTRLFANARRELVQYPGLSSLLQTMEPTPNADRLRDACDDILRDAGFDDDAVALATPVLIIFLLGHVSYELTRPIRLASTANTSRAHRKQLMVDEPSSDDEFDFGMSVLIVGLRERLARADRHTGAEPIRQEVVSTS